MDLASTGIQFIFTLLLLNFDTVRFPGASVGPEKSTKSETWYSKHIDKYNKIKCTINKMQTLTILPWVANHYVWFRAWTKVVDCLDLELIGDISVCISNHMLGIYSRNVIPLFLQVFPPPWDHITQIRPIPLVIKKGL